MYARLNPSNATRRSSRCGIRWKWGIRSNLPTITILGRSTINSRWSMRENSCGEARSVARGSGWPPSARSVYRRAYRPIHRRRGRVSWRGRVAGRLPLDLGENPNGFGSVPWSRKLSFRPKGDAPWPAVLAGVANQEATACHHGSRNVSHSVHGGGQICRGVFPCRPGGLALRPPELWKERGRTTAGDQSLDSVPRLP